jgi:alpha-ribazole phosphatase/probable phosphoglycerate mutase
MTPAITTIDLLRHGEPVGGRRYRGRRDDPLSDTGWSQMRAAVDRHRPWQVIVSSPLARCRVFAEELAARHGLELEIDARWQEIGFGEWEGCTVEELQAREPERLGRFWRDPCTYTPPGGEPLAIFAARITAVWRSLLRRHAGRHVLMIGHAGVIRMVLRQVIHVPFARLLAIDVPYAAWSRVQVKHLAGGDQPALVFHARSP